MEFPQLRFASCVFEKKDTLQQEGCFNIYL